MPTPLHWLEATAQARISLRRYTPQLERPCLANEPWGHDATSEAVAVVPLLRGDSKGDFYPHVYPDADAFVGHPGWPVQCASCDYQFQSGDEQQVIQAQLYARSDTGALVTLAEAEVGACYDGNWRGLVGPDGINLVVRVPGGHDWHVDSQAANCGWSGQPHRCWVRTGNPRKPETLDVRQGACPTGAGSISVRNGYHGFLHNGVLTDHLG